MPDLTITPGSPTVVEIIAGEIPVMSVVAGRQGPPGPSTISADPGNIAKLGSDNLISVDVDDVESALPKPFYLSLPIETETIFLFPIDVSFPAGLVGSIGFAEVAPAAIAVNVALAKNNVTIGYAVWNVGQTTPYLSLVNPVEFHRGDRLKATPPSNIDPIFHGASLTLVGQRL